MNILQKFVQMLTRKLSPKDKPVQKFSENRVVINERLVKRYTKSELAAIYNRPVNTIMRWIYTDDELMHELNQTGYKRFQKEFKKEQVRIIFKHLGEPDYPQ